MKVCVLYSADFVSDQGVAVSAEGVPEPTRTPLEIADYGPRHKFTFCELTKGTTVRRLKKLAAQGFDVFLNLCDGAWDEDRPGVEVAQTLERLGQAFTGAGSAFWEPTREAMKRVCHHLDIPYPRGVQVTDGREAAAVASRLRFPMIVKHPSSYASIGLTPASRVQTVPELAAQIDLMTELYGGALVEEFIEGREYTVLVAEVPDGSPWPKAYPPMECVFPPGQTFKHYDLKWREYDSWTWSPVTDERLAEELMRVSVELFAGLGGSGYARTDIRVNAAGIPYVLEINPNCSMFYPPEIPGAGADEVLRTIQDGHEEFIETILSVALARQRASRRPYVVDLRDERHGYATYAAVPIARDQLIMPGEQRPYTLVTREYAAAHWPQRQLEWLDRYGWPLGDQVFATWNADPEQWAPMSHSCDPNTWFEGLHLVARRPIAVGEQITLDYATFVAGTGASFDCQCGALDCRGKVMPDDWQRPELRARYAGHASPHVKAKWTSGGDSDLTCGQCATGGS